MADVNILIRGMDVNRLIQRLSDLAANDILVGVPSQNADQRNATASINNAALAYIHEFGCPKKNIPARPFLFPAIASSESLIARRFRAATELMISGDESSGIIQLERLGAEIRDAVKRNIRSNTPPPLKTGTLLSRRRRGITRTNTLVDTGAMLNSINYVRVIR